MLATDLFDLEFADAREGRREVASLFRQAERISVSENAEKFVKVEVPGGASKYWDREETPYMVKPSDSLTRRDREAVIFVGPARAGKTQSLLDNWLGHIVLNDPADTLFVHMTERKAAEYSKKRVDRLHDSSPEIGKMIRRGTSADNVGDKYYRHGMALKIAHPSPSELAAMEYKYVGLTDYDAMPQHIGTEGTPFQVAGKRVETYMSGGMVLAESSPRFDAIDPDWRPSSLHELPFTKGICSLFNLGTREVYYWICPECGEAFIPDFPEAFFWDSSLRSIDEQARSVEYCCRANGCMIPVTKKRELNINGLWVPDGCEVVDGQLQGEELDSVISSFRLPAGCSAYMKPEAIVRKWLSAEQDYEATGDETSMRGTTQIDHGRPYKPKSHKRDRTADELHDRAEDLGDQMIPPNGRFLKFSVDVQQFSFEVAAVVWAPGNERFVIDRFSIKRSLRQLEEATYDVIQPAMYAEDWNVLVHQVMNKRYPLSDGSGRTMGAKLTCCDSGGYSDGEYSVTARGYEFYTETVFPNGLHDRFVLVKGDGRKGVPRIRMTYPDSPRKDRKAKARGEVPVYHIGTEIIKDSLNQDLNRTGGGRLCIHFSDQLDRSVFEEMVAEIKHPKKGWIKHGSGNNETWDLLCYDRATAIPLGVDRAQFWESPPIWAREWDKNSLVSDMPGTSPTTPQKTKPRGAKGRKVRSRGLSSV